ncbi:MAG: hypothetical protein LBB98_13630 [Treponema sp.]|nr:hypothetical protein [Treponema sp.]
MFSCAGIPDEVPAPALPFRTYTRNETPYQIIEHKAGNLKEDLPDWVVRYISDGISGVEALPRYANHYVFIGVNSGANFTALSHWSAGFIVDQDFSQLVSLRVLARFIGDGQRSPDRDYGRYFEAAVRNAADTFYPDAIREDNFWLLKRYENEDETGPDEVYDFYILVSIAKDLLQSQLNQVLINAEEGLTLTRDQIGAVNRLRESFYAGF